ncbi:beta-1,4-galactosyltransferase 1 [Copidosoma floridanum]|uniref:beta-1,4-galactosyltransferase 1 n=1 Tax=Copidosoma floridanum TaxID=29053 RepID=UPI0006C9D871|nr:beta-1,4-galactosyltransferase 1 [Copidosoma floridanum]
MFQTIVNVSKLIIGLLHKHSRFLLNLFLISLVLCFCLHPLRFASHYNYICPEKIPFELEPAYFPKKNACMIVVATQAHLQLFYPDKKPLEESQFLAYRLSILPGGQWRPQRCQPLFNVAIILPYRNRQIQLLIFLNYIHPFLQLQNLDYRIFVVEQTSDKEFNRAKLFNVGFVEASKTSNFHCFIFQDIDLIPQNLRNIYACTKLPRHMSSSVNTFRYNLPYTGLFGGAIAITKHLFLQVNGFSNVYFGWGAEDDDFYNRLQSKGLPVTRFSPEISRYFMLSHRKESPSITRFTHLEEASKRFNTDGISNLQYRIISHQLQPLYSWILVKI